MKKNKLGRSGLLLGDLTLGTMTFGDTTSAQVADQMLGLFEEAGGNHLDTANVYAAGRSESILGDLLKKKRDRFIIASKVRFPRGDGSNEAGLSRRHILHAVAASLHRLQTDYLDLLYLHGWDPLTPLEETLRTVDDLITSGKVRYLGVSNFQIWQLMKGLHLSDWFEWHRFIAAQYQYSLIEREIEYEYPAMCLEEGVGLMPWSPLGGGFLSGKYKADQEPTEGRISVTGEETEEHWSRRNTERNWRILETVNAVAQQRGATCAQVAIAWLRAKPAVTSVILGARTVAQLEDNLAAASLDLSPDEIARLDAVSALPERYPYRFYEEYCNRKLHPRDKGE